MTSETPASATESRDALRFAVEPGRCIGCTACVHLFPALFRMEGDKALAFATTPAGSVPAGRVVHSCPTAAIQPEGAAAAPTPPERLVEVEGWEAEWEKHRDAPEDPAERERRYGRVLHRQSLDGCFVVRLELPRTLPNHMWVYAYGIRRTAPDYGFTLVQVGPKTVSVRGRLLDPRLRLLAGKLNSFPNMLKVDLGFPAPIGAAYFRMDRDDLWVYAVPAEGSDPQARLAALVRRQLGTAAGPRRDGRRT